MVWIRIFLINNPKDDCIKASNDIPDYVLNLLTQLKVLKKEFEIEVNKFENNFRIILRESRTDINVKIRRCILILLSDDPCSYSIRLFKQLFRDSDRGIFKQIYEIEVKGDNDFRLIKQDVKDLINGKKGPSFHSTYPL